MAAIPFDNRYARLPERFYSHARPTPVAHPALVRVTEPLRDHLGIDPSAFDADAGAELLGGRRLPDGAEPIATAYAGHQFGRFNPQLGDGRAILLGEVVAEDGLRYELQLKGSGITRYSRGGDGRSPLGPVLREYIVSEAMAALGIPTTRALAAATTGEPVFRDRPLPGGVLLRVARSHVRVGTFEFFAARDDEAALRVLVEHVIARHAPECADAPAPALSLLQHVAEHQADLIAQWQLVGFIHGVMNTDNMLISGETIDYGPCAFMDAYDPDTVFSSIDRFGRYAYANQPAIARFNLACLARALLPVIVADDPRGAFAAQEVVDAFPEQHARAHRAGLRRKLGLSEERPGDDELAAELFEAMQRAGADFTCTFRGLCDLAQATVSDVAPAPCAPRALDPGLAPWLERWRARFSDDGRDASERAADMRAVNPARIPRNHRIEQAIRAAEDDADLRPFHDLVDALAEPYRDAAHWEHYERPPRPEERVLQTFCGT